MPTAARIHIVSDAMNEVGWCYLEGFGCKKDKVSRPDFLNKSTIQPPRVNLISEPLEVPPYIHCGSLS